MLPSGAVIQTLTLKPYWGVTGTNKIDLQWMSTTAGRRDLPKGQSGMFMAASDSKVTFVELKIQEDVRLEGCSYLVQFETTIKVADYRKAGDAGWSGGYYGPDYNFSHQQFTEAKPELEKSGCMGFLRKSAAMMSKGEDGDVLVVFPEATGNLIVKSIRPLGDPKAEATIKLPDGTIYPVQKYFPENADKKDEFKPLIP